MISSPVATIDLAALARNYGRVAAAVDPAEAAAVVKANAYGLGVGPVAAALVNAGCRSFFVATVDEGVELRGLLPAHSNARIFILDGFPGDAGPLLENGLIPVLNTVEQIRQWSDAGPAAVQIDTGMNRLGVSAGEFEDAFRAGLPLDTCILVVTHLACADEPDHPLTAWQLDRFARIRQLLPETPVSIGNSAGGFLGSETRGDLVRAGIGLFGGNPFVGRESPVEPVVTLTAPIIQLRRVEHDETVGYGASLMVPAGTLLATLAIGYADGYLRALGNAGTASVRAQRVPVVGRVSMDLLTIDVSALGPNGIEVGDAAELFGSEVSIDEVAAAAGTISYELLTSIGKRVARRYINE